MRKIMINESQCLLLREGLSSLLYHFTSINNGFSICKDDKIYLQSALAKDADNYDKKRKFYLSCTRVRSSDFGYSYKFSRGGVRITLDGDLLSNNFAGKQINYWNGLNDKFKYYEYFPERSKDIEKAMSWEIDRFKKSHPDATPEDIRHFIEYNFNDAAQHHTDNESEDRLLSYEPVIEDAHRYIKSVDVLLPGLKENDDESMKIASAFRFSVPPQIGRLVKIFDSVEEFNKPNGVNCNGEVEYSNGMIPQGRLYNRTYEGLESTIVFIAYANPEFEENKFGAATASLLNKYGLDKFKGRIGDMAKRRKSVWGFDGMVENLDASRRDLSDRPSEDNSKILKMLTDYVISIGANSFREAYIIKKRIANEYYGHDNKTYERINTEIKYNFYTFRYGVISLYPNKDLFKDAMGWNDNEAHDWAETFTGIIMYEDGYNNSGSKNYNSMYQYIYKLFRKGSVLEVLNAFKKLGFTDEYLESDWNIRTETLDYWGVRDKNTVDASKIYDNNYKQARELNKKEIDEYFLNIQKVSN